MAYVTVPKDLTKVKSKVVFGLTKRQLICFGGALLVGVPLFFLIRGRVPTSAAALIRDDCRNISAITNLLFHQYMDTL